MNDQTQTGTDHWKGRSAAWTATAPEGLPSDDTLDRMLIAHAAIRPGERILDIGSGTGDPAISIAITLGRNGRVTASDLTLDMLRTARERTRRLGLDNVGFVACDMAALPFGDDTFDGTTCRFGLMFPKDRVAAVAEALRVVRPGGRVAYIVWGPYEENPSFYHVSRTLSAFLGEPERPSSQRHSLGAQGLLSKILCEAGCREVREEALVYERTVDDLDGYLDRALRRGYAAQVSALDESERDRLMDALRSAFAPYKRNGVTAIPTHARLGLGWKAR